MCGRYTLKTPRDQIVKRFHIACDLLPQDLLGRYNIAPAQPVAAVRIGSDGVRELVTLRWGLIPHWAKEAKTGYSMINARAESVAIKPAFRDAFRRRRCLIPADGFYEWQPRPRSKLKQPWYFQFKGGELFAFAGLWERWEPRPGQAGEPVESCTILVTDANELVRPIHDRMPVILDPTGYEPWLDPAYDSSALHALLKAYPAHAMTAWKIGTRVNNPRNDDSACLEPVGSPDAASTDPSRWGS